MSEELGPIATRILYEDDEVRIWDQRLAPGESTAAHRHDNAYVLVDVRGDRIRASALEGHAGEYEGEIDLEVARGRVYSLSAGAVERATNVGDRAYRAVLVEFKTEADGA